MAVVEHMLVLWGRVASQKVTKPKLRMRLRELIDDQMKWK